jgi:hypothetical protein
MLHSAESQLCAMRHSAKSRLDAIPHSAYFFLQNIILSAFTEAVKVKVYKKSAIGDLTCLMAVKYIFKVGII